MNFLSIVYLEVIGDNCGVMCMVIHGYIIYHKYCKQLINILYLRACTVHNYNICPPITKLHMSYKL